MYVIIYVYIIHTHIYIYICEATGCGSVTTVSTPPIFRQAQVLHPPPSSTTAFVVHEG